MEQKRKPGRPPKAPGERKRPVEVGMTDSERLRVLAAAESMGLSLSAFIRSAALEAAGAR